MADAFDPRPIPRARLTWLEHEADSWRRAGIVDDATLERIFAGYVPESPRRRGTQALVVLAALMVGIGVLLLIGYNWARLTPAVKVGLTMTGVAMAFVASAYAFARRRPLAGETFALVGTFAFANSIWLIAQVLHIQGHFPDGFMWSALGTFAVAYVLRSRWVGVEAALFALAWVCAAGVAPPHAPKSFLAFAPVAIAVAYSLRSPVMLRTMAFACALWVFVIDPQRLDHVVVFSAAAITGCAFYAVGAWHRTDVVMRRAWQTTGLTVILALFPALLVTEFHEFARAGHWKMPSMAIAVVAALLTATLFARRYRDGAGNAVAVTAGLLVVWSALMASGVKQPHYLWVTLFSLVTLLLSTALIQTALRTDNVATFAFGILFGLAFLIVRWASVIENMLWSGLMLLAAGAGLLLLARLWRHRDRQMALQGGTS